MNDGFSRDKKIVDGMIEWLKSMVNDKDMQPIQNTTYQQCLDKLEELYWKY